MENQEHKRASYAWRCIEDIDNKLNQKEREKYHTLVSSLPTRLQTTGLMQTLAFNCSKMDKDKKPYFVKLNAHLMKWILGETGATAWNENAAQVYQTFTTTILNDLGTEKLMIHTRQTLDLAIWLKRFAEGKWGKVDKGENDVDN